MICRFDRVLCKTARDERFNAMALNLAHQDAGLIKKNIAEIEELYQADFKPTTAPATAATHVVSTSEQADGVTVQLVGENLTEDPVRRSGGREACFRKTQHAKQ